MPRRTRRFAAGGQQVHQASPEAGVAGGQRGRMHWLVVAASSALRGLLAEQGHCRPAHSAGRQPYSAPFRKG